MWEGCPLPQEVGGVSSPSWISGSKSYFMCKLDMLSGQYGIQVYCHFSRVHVSQQSAGYGHNECGYQCGIRASTEQTYNIRLSFHILLAYRNS